MQTILGAGGTVAVHLARELRQYTDQVRLFSRNPKPVVEGNLLLAGNLLDSGTVKRAVEGSDVVYLVAGLPYNYRIWQQQWPVVIQNVLGACREHKSKLVFLDNIYGYDKASLGHMTEDTPVNPCSEKGKTRAVLAEMLCRAMDHQEIAIGRSADFYGPGSKNGVLNILAIDRLMAGRKAMWQGSVHHVHSFTYVPDVAKALALLGNSPEACGQSWHLPTSPEKLKGIDYITLIAEKLNTKPGYSLLKNWMLKLAGLVEPKAGELVEMAYQYDRPYFFDSTKFNEQFAFTPRSYSQGIDESINFS